MINTKTKLVKKSVHDSTESVMPQTQHSGWRVTQSCIFLQVRVLGYDRITAIMLSIK